MQSWVGLCLIYTDHNAATSAALRIFSTCPFARASRDAGAGSPPLMALYLIHAGCRYLGYTNELGESFKAFLSKAVYRSTYAVRDARYPSPASSPSWALDLYFELDVRAVTFALWGACLLGTYPVSAARVLGT